jgi:DNA-binding transcriptional LysR family regulator
VDTAEIEVFLVLAEELHFGRTAERMRVPQPRVSRLVAALEHRVGGALFERTSRRVQLTPLGRRLREQLRPAYAQLTEALADARTAAREATGVLRIGFTATASSELLTRLVEAFEAGEHRHAVMDVVSNFDPYSALRRGELDVLVNWLALDEPDLTAGPAIAEQDRVLAVASGDPLASRPSVSIEDLADRDVALMTPSFPRALYDAIIPPFTPSGRVIPRTQPVRSIHELVSLVARGRIVHPTAAGIPMLGRDDITLVPITDLPPLPLGLIWVTAHDNARIQALAETARSLREPRG